MEENTPAEGYVTTVGGNYSHAEGYRTTTNNTYSHVNGQLNKDRDTNDLFVLGYGSSGTRKNIFRITTAGAVYGLSAFNFTGANYAEFFEWQDGNPYNEDRTGVS